MDNIERRAPHYPTQRCTPDFGESDSATDADFGIQRSSLTANHANPNRQGLRGLVGKGTVLGTWRDSDVPESRRKHAVIGFIDVRDRLRARILPNTKEGESLEAQYPLPPGPGGGWVTFERIVFSDHLIGLNQLQVKEYTRLRTDVPPEATEDERIAAEKAAAQEAIRLVKDGPSFAQPPATAFGATIPENLLNPLPDLEPRRSSSGFVSVNAETLRPQSQPPALAHQARPVNGPLPGTRPTSILVGCWKPSNQVDPHDRHAVYGILQKDDKFRVKVVRQTREGRHVDGNFPSGAGALWVQYEEVEFEPHLQPLNRQEVKEYCRVRQFQLDNGERPKERDANETQAVHEARKRATIVAHEPLHRVAVPALAAVPQPERDRPGHNGQDLLQARPPIARPFYPSSNGGEFRVPTPQVDREQRAAHSAVNNDANAAAFAATVAANMPVNRQHHLQNRPAWKESEDARTRSGPWTRQEASGASGKQDNTRIYDGMKYERKAAGPFMGKLASQGKLIKIDGEDYVEYRVLNKPSFF